MNFETPTPEPKPYTHIHIHPVIYYAPRRWRPSPELAAARSKIERPHALTFVLGQRSRRFPSCPYGPSAGVRGAHRALGNSSVSNSLAARVGRRPEALTQHMLPARDPHLPPQRPLSLGLKGGWNNSAQEYQSLAQMRPFAFAALARLFRQPLCPSCQGSIAAKDGGPAGPSA